MKKVDIHAHVALNDSDIEFNHVKFSGCSAMKNHMEKLGIERAVIMSLEDQNDMFTSNHAAAEIVKRYPEFYCWFCNIPQGEKDPYNLLKKMKRQGALGLGEWVTHLPLDHPYMEEIMGASEELELPILFHLSPDPDNQYGIIDEPGLYLLEEALKKFPKLMLIGHSQAFWYEISNNDPCAEKGRGGYPSGLVEPGGRLPYLMENYKNLYCDLSANSGGNAMMRDPDFGIKFLEKYQDRLFFGTDMANVAMNFPFGGWLDEQVQKGRISQMAYEKICSRNAYEKIIKEVKADV
ncbi:amidohydrolase family protein [Clostridium sp. MCC353]|uniref:amidohydrolase family protein n=1 Tax=Clostridium sp. MCC353 TaxID=2592646 RepID=UPI001C00AD4E|nr:amidohydrolase family protein [Clostridium sp. MCC353]MBT9778949.1 amidohydrolase family protein [Clostridium sp. MCC353]